MPSQPYFTGGALIGNRDRLLYGREDVFSTIQSTLTAKSRTPILIYGQRRIGKSTVLKNIGKYLPDDVICINFDLQGYASHSIDDLYLFIAREIVDYVDVPKPKPGEVDEGIFLNKFLPATLQALDNEQHRLVFLFDEFDILDKQESDEDMASQRFIKSLAVMIDKYPDIGYIMVVGRKAEELSQVFLSSVLRDALLVRIGRLEYKDTVRLIVEPAEGHLDYGPGALDRIFSLTAGHPYCTQLLCYTIWSEHISEDTPFVRVTPAMVEDSLGLALENGAMGLNWIFENITEVGHKLFLSSLAEVSDPFYNKGARFASIEKNLSENDISLAIINYVDAPDVLEAWDVVKKIPGGLQFAVPMHGLWIRENRSLEYLKTHVRYANPRAYDYFKLAQDAYNEKNLDQAITDYRAALNVYPYYYEAQLSLANTLLERRADGDLAATIEAFERVLELNTGAPTASFIQALTLAFGSPEFEVDEIPGLYTRFQALSPDTKMEKRARRILEDRYHSLVDFGVYNLALKLFNLLETDKTILEFKDLRRKRNISVAFDVVITVLAVGALVFRLRFATTLDLATEWKILLWSFVGAVLGSWFLSIEPGINSVKKASFFRRVTILSKITRVVLGTAAGFAGGYLYWRVFGGDTANQVVATIIALYLWMYFWASNLSTSRQSPSR